MEEVRLGIMSLKGGKAGGVDNIVAKLLKPDPETSSQKLHEIIKHIWKEEEIPSQWLRGLIVKIPKKGDLKDCSNWRGIRMKKVSVPSLDQNRQDSLKGKIPPNRSSYCVILSSNHPNGKCP